MKIITCASINDDLFKKIKSEFSDFKYEKHILTLPEDELNEVEVLVGYPFNITNEVLEKLPKLKLIHIMQSGVEGLPYDELIRRNITVTSSRGINSITIAEYIIGEMLSITRNSLEFYESQKLNEWNTNTNIDEIYNKTIGILGYGAVGMELAKRCKAFGMKVLATKRNFKNELDNVDKAIKPDNINELVKDSDFIVSLLPLTEQTKHIIDKEQIDLMKENSVFINVSRSKIVNLDYLLVKLGKNEIKAVVLDVFDKEPLSNDSELWNIENLYLTPHIAGDRFPLYKQRAFDILLENLRNLDKGKEVNMINVVNKEQGY